jgi:hypothetical protein
MLILQMRWCLHIQVNGEMYHQIGNFEPQNEKDLHFCQIYLMDPGIQSERRLQSFSDLDAATI